ncbi:MAG: hypothetical protein HYY18_21090 [Planctomycetes bacterium]|nr:hypothetical protein [Planctomycetota bacterium]
MRDTLRERLAPYELRLRLLRAARCAVAGALGGAALGAAWILAAKWFRWPHALEIGLGLFFAGKIGAFAWRMARPLPLEDVARATDRAAGANDRFSSAWELDGSEWGPLLERDLQAQVVPGPRTAFPARPGRWVKWPVAACGGLLALAFFVPARPVPPRPAIESDLAGMSAPPELAQAAEELRRLGALDDQPELAGIGRELSEIDRDWKSGAIDRKEALARVGEMRSRLRKLREKMAADKEALARMAESESGHELAHRLATGEGREAVKEAASRLGKDAQADAKLGNALDNAARAAGSDKELSAALESAAAAARRGDAKKFEEEMGKAGERWKPLARKGKEAAEKERLERGEGSGETAGKDPKNGGSETAGKDPKEGGSETAGKDPKNGGSETAGKDPKEGGSETAGKDPKNGGSETAGKDPKEGGSETAGKDPKNGGSETAGKDPKEGGGETGGKDPKNGGSETAGKDPKEGGSESAGKDPKNGGGETAGKDPRNGDNGADSLKKAVEAARRKHELEEKLKQGGDGAQDALQEALKNLDPDALKDLADRMKEKGLDKEKLEEAFNEAMKKDGEARERGEGESKLGEELAEKFKDSELMKDMAKKLAENVDPETLASLAERFGDRLPKPDPSCPPGGD